MSEQVCRFANVPCPCTPPEREASVTASASVSRSWVSRRWELGTFLAPHSSLLRAASFILQTREDRVNRNFCRLHGIALALAIAAPLQSQGYPFSQRGTVSQTVAFTDIKVTYGRPVARGRVLFGKLVPWDSIWHPGADSATRISFSREVLLEGQRLAPGEYSVWIIPRASKPWTVILNRKAHVFHSPYPGSQFDVLRTDVSPESTMPMESMAFYFPVVLRD